MLPVLARELLGQRTLPREPEPDLVMEDEAQVRAYAEAGRADGIMSAAYLFHTARITQAIQGCREVLDLACGPATQLAQVAALNPSARFLGVDLSDNMLEDARAHVREKGLQNVSFQRADVTTIESIRDGSMDAVISTMAMHQLPTLDHVRACFRQVRRVLKEPGALYIADFARLKSLKSVIYFAYLNSAKQPHIFTLDYERSLRAAFLREELDQLRREELPANAELLSTFAIPILTLIKTSDRPLSDALRSRFAEMRRGLPRRYRRDLDEIRLFFRAGGLANDPFR
jgi:ubiquinone/menaquinone biosynthesis C-methylase UbiE